MITQEDLVVYANALAPKKWYTGDELTAAWGVTIEHRRNIVPRLKKCCMISTTGKTSKIRYKVRPPSDWQVKESPFWPVPPKKTEAKLRKEADLRTTTSSLENLITAATELGSSNEILRGKLVRIRKILDEA